MTTDNQIMAAVTGVVAAVEHAQNTEDPDAFLALFRDDAIWTTGGGHRLFGLEAIAEFTRRVLPGGMAGSTVTFEVEHVLLLRPDVAAVKVIQTYHTADGTEVGSPMFVMTREPDGRWLLTACQNTMVHADA